MKILIACEYSGIVRDAFIKKGHDAISCDLLDTDVPGPHFKGDIFEIINDGFDMMIAHPPCTYLTLAGARWYYDPKDKLKPHPKFPDRKSDFKKAISFFNKIKSSNINKICVENSQPLGVAMDEIGRYTQKVQPWMFGSNKTKGACLWLKGLPNLKQTHDRPGIVVAKCHMESPGKDRWKRRSVTDYFLADAMAEQWG